MTNTKLTTTGAAATIEEIHPDILIQALRHLDGPSLASASCATSHLRSLSSDPDLWRRLCLSTWPSLRHPRLLPLLNSSPHRLFSDAYPFPAPSSLPADDTDLPDQLISAVDIYHHGIPIFSCAVETDTSTPWFRSSPFLIDAPSAAAADVSPEDLILSWIVIDPARGRAVNLSSRGAVAVGKRHWCVGETVARFATVRDGWAVGPAVTWRKGRGDVMEVGLMMEDMDGMCVSGMEGLRMVKAAMEAERKGKGEEEAKEKYLEYLKMKRNREERRDRREWFMDMCCVTVIGVAVFLSFVFLFVFR